LGVTTSTSTQVEFLTTLSNTASKPILMQQ